MLSRVFGGSDDERNDIGGDNMVVVVVGGDGGGGGSGSGSGNNNCFDHCHHSLSLSSFLFLPSSIPIPIPIPTLTSTSISTSTSTSIPTAIQETHKKKEEKKLQKLEEEDNNTVDSILSTVESLSSSSSLLQSTGSSLVINSTDHDTNDDNDHNDDVKDVITVHNYHPSMMYSFPIHNYTNPINDVIIYHDPNHNHNLNHNHNPNPNPNPNHSHEHDRNYGNNNNHGIKNTTNRLIQCPQCDYTMPQDLNEIEKHQKRCLFLIFFCKECLELFSNKQQLMNHKKNHCKILISNITKEKIKRMKILARRRKRIKKEKEKEENENENENEYQCDVCDKGCGNFIHLQQHVYYIHQKEPIHGVLNLCPYCNKYYQTRKSLKKHIYGCHSGIKPFLCLLCPRAFSRKYCLEIHMQTHMSYKDRERYHCHLCNSKFTNPSNLTRHMKRVHHISL